MWWSPPTASRCAAIIDFGGFLGVGSRKIAIDWRLLRFDPASPIGRWRCGLEPGRGSSRARNTSPMPPPTQMVAPPCGGPGVEQWREMTGPARWPRPARRRTRRQATGDLAAGDVPGRARARLAQPVRRQHPDRLRAVHRRLSDDPGLDRNLDRPRAQPRHDQPRWRARCRPARWSTPSANKAAVVFFSILAFSLGALLVRHPADRRSRSTWPRCSTAFRAAPWGRRSPRSVSPSPARRCWACGSAATPASPRSATGSVPR